MDNKIEIKATGNTNPIEHETDVQIGVRLIRQLIAVSVILTAPLIALKWWGAITWSWWWVASPALILSPLWAILAVLVILTIFGEKINES